MNQINDIKSFLLNNKCAVLEKTSKELAIILNTTTTDINRASKKLGYESFTDLKYGYKYSTMEKVEEIKIDFDLRSVLENKKIYLYGRGNSKISVEYLGRFLLLSDYEYIIPLHEHDFRKIDQNCVLIVISKSGETKDVISLTSKLNSKKIKIISICPSNSSIAKNSTYNIATNKSKYNNTHDEVSQIEQLKVADFIGDLLLHK